jgi:hypothetical protein
MIKLKFLLGPIAFSVLQACMGDPPKARMASKSADASGQNLLTEDPALSINKSQCTGSKMILASTAGARFTWGANKGTSTNVGVDIPVVGTTKLAGCIFPKLEKKADGSQVQTLSGGTASFDFRPQTTASFSELRDNRIIQYIFGYDLPNDPEGSALNNDKTGLLRFDLQSVTGNSLELPTTVGDAIGIKVLGTLQIAGFSVPLEVPVALTKTTFGFSAVNSDEFSLNIRGGKQALNTLGLDQRVTEILALVANATLQDTIDVKFTVDFINLCGG